jgi:hypothetical protein
MKVQTFFFKEKKEKAYIQAYTHTNHDFSLLVIK